MTEVSVVEQRYQAVMAVIGDGLSVSQVAEKVGVSRQPERAYVGSSDGGNALSPNGFST
jgi:transposase